MKTDISANNICEKFKRNCKQFPLNENVKLVNYECVPIKSYNDCISNNPVEMQVYKIEKRHLNIRFQALETLFVVDVNVVQKTCYTR